MEIEATDLGEVILLDEHSLRFTSLRRVMVLPGSQPQTSGLPR
ncbi:hypothetical protein SF83666_c25220 [Sinorhizobium fredii CCBAU 83666]|nr:hypothetical protein SF83666_c25220 [Sinorhizobium fredii CCBAU 83666]